MDLIGSSKTYELRLQKLRRKMKENDLDGVVLAPGPNLRYYTGVSSQLLERPFLFFMPQDAEPHLIAPTLESGPYFKAPIKIAVHDWDDSEGPSHVFERTVDQLQMRGRWGSEGRVPFRFIHYLMKYADSKLEDAEPLLQSTREVKDKEEIQLLERAASILCKSYLKIPEILRPGVSELELAREIAEEIYSNGAEWVETPSGVLSGERTSDPHSLPCSKKIRKRESIVIDVACTYSGYYADVTRTFIIGRNKRFENLYRNVLEAQELAIKLSRSEVAVGSIDQAARERLRQSRLDKYFIHRTGHGLGLEVHEAPYIVSGGTQILQPSMIFTVEPGVYIPNKTGLRIEDEILVTEHGYRSITRALPKEFAWWE
jgi:Xaa-Pro aminopeptidase/Xaa-Pro dipeptidase